MATIDRKNVTVDFLRGQIDKAADLRLQHDELKKRTSAVWSEYVTIADDVMATMMALDLKKMDGKKSGKVFYWTEGQKVKVPKSIQEFAFLNEQLTEQGLSGYLTINYQKANSLAKEILEEQGDLDTPEKKQTFLEKFGFEVDTVNSYGMRKG